MKIENKKLIKESNEVVLATLYSYLAACSGIKGMLNLVRFSDGNSDIWQSLVTRALKLDSLGRNKYGIRVVNVVDFTFDLNKSNIKAISFSNNEKTKIYLETKCANMEFHFDDDIAMYVE